MVDPRLGYCPPGVPRLAVSKYLFRDPSRLGLEGDRHDANAGKGTELASIPGLKLMALDTTDADQIQHVAQDVRMSSLTEAMTWCSRMRGYGMAGPSKASRTTRSSA